MESAQRLPASLTPLESALDGLLQRVAAVTSVELPLAEALGCIAADMPALAAFPPDDTAVTDGWALRARDLVGASSYSPLPLSASPVWVDAGDPMPAANSPRVIVLPIPPAAPVTIATLWVSLMSISSG